MLTVKGKKFWGDSYWKTIHCSTAAYKPENAKPFKQFTEALPYLLPCEECSEHLIANLKIVPVDSYLGSNHDLFFWGYIIHDRVNQAYNKEHPDQPPKYSPPFDQVKAYYFRALSEDCKACSTL